MKQYDFFHVYDVPRHEDIKDKLLLYFDDMTEKYNLNINQSSNITSTDYFLVKDHKIKIPPYSELIHEFVYSSFSEDILNKFSCKGISFSGCWFQQYDHGSSFSYHTHPKSHLAGIYYIELPEGSETEFDGFTPPTVKEGQVLIFPSFIPHRSNANPSLDRKTVVAFNFDLFYKKHE